MPNLLAAETSPYLLQHKGNPVDWMPWGAPAFERAKKEDKPIFLSVGYSSCHWCHVMEHESFEDAEVAAELNKGFVSVKVDREERPEVDEAYMTAVQLQSGRGGWPMSVFLTPEGDPFFAGTYFPKLDRGGYPGFLTILKQLGTMWASQKVKVIEAAKDFRQSLEAAMERPAPKTFRALDAEFIRDAFHAVAADFDPRHGGFGKAPKFPPHSALAFCLAYARSSLADEMDRTRAALIAEFTLEKMCLGGVRDHVGGGFHRYSTDEVWLVPHFEKMLYDNALMLENLAPAGDSSLFRSPLDGAARWLEEEMRTSEGLFCSAVDADSEGKEGKYYVWTEQEVRHLLGDRADAFLKAYRFEAEGNYLDEATHRRTGANIPHLAEPPAGDLAAELNELRHARAKRIPPMTDDKALVGWNGLAIAGLAAAGRHEPAIEAAEKILSHRVSAGELPHHITRSKASGHAYLEDFAGLLYGLTALGGYESHAERLFNEAELLRDPAAGDYFATSPNHDKLFGRTKPVFDQPIPSANALMARSLIRLGKLEEARQVIEASLGWIERAPGSTEAMLLAALELLEAQGAGPTPKQHKVELKPHEVVACELVPSVLKAGTDGWAYAKLRVQVREGFHLNTNNPPARWLKPTEVVVEGLEAKVEYPPASNDRFEGDFEIKLMLRGKGGFEAVLRCQPCSETECLEEVEKRITGQVEPN